jgi:hypothetical protein
MDISIGSYKLRLEILILIVIVSWILFGHLLCGCSKVSFMEGLSMMKEGLSKNTLSSMSNMNSKEGFTGANNVAYGPEFAGAKTPDYIMNPSTWSMPTLTYSPGTTPNAGVKAIWDRPKQPIPLPKDELDMFATTEFKPECCPNAYSNSMGCACMTVDQYKYLISRGSNNVPYDIY